MKTIFSVLILFISMQIRAKHIVGGEILYDFLGQDKYRVVLKVYRDCNSGGASFDGIDYPCYLTVREGNGALTGTYSIGAPVIKTIPPAVNNKCMAAPTGVCVEEGVYQYTLSLQPKAGGYYVIYQRCCRNNTIVNLVNSGDQGSTYYTRIPGPDEAAINSSPRFNKFPPIYLCNNVPFIFDHSATDPDGDELVYSLYTPFVGLSANSPALGGSGPTEAPPPPFQNISYSGFYSGNYPVSASPAFSINTASGKLTGKPNLTGQYVVGVCVKEFRNGQLINIHYRDFQFNIINCDITVMSLFDEQKKKCMGLTFNFANQSYGSVPMNFHWDFGVPGIESDTSSAVDPLYTYPNTGTYTVTLIANPGKACSDTFTQTYYAYPELTANFEKPSPQCLKGNSFNFKNTSVYTPEASFTWYLGSGATPSFCTLKDANHVIFDVAGKHAVKLHASQFVCDENVCDTVTVFDRPHAKINNLPSQLCAPAKVSFTNSSTSDLPFINKWTFSNGTSSADSDPVMLLTPSGVYSASLMIVTNGLCNDTSFSSVQNITVNPSPHADFILNPDVMSYFDNQIKITNSASEDVVAWNYLFGDNSSANMLLNPVHSYKAPGIYTVTQVVKNDKNCGDTIRKLVNILRETRFWIPNTFTPNGDNLNDIFMPVSVGLLNYEFEIYNRWGERLFTTTDPDKGWNGSYSGKECQEGVYVWRITFISEIDLKPEIKYGTVLLLRNAK